MKILLYVGLIHVPCLLSYMRDRDTPYSSISMPT